MPLANARDEFVRHKNLGAVGVEPAVRPDDAIEREQDDLADEAALRDRRRDAVGDHAVALFQDFLFRGAEAVEINVEPPVVQESGRDEAAAAARAEAGDMAVHVHNAGREGLDGAERPGGHAGPQKHHGRRGQQGDFPPARGGRAFGFIQLHGATLSETAGRA